MSNAQSGHTPTDTTSTTTDDIIDALYSLDCGDRGDAATLADKVVDHVIAALQRNQRMPRLGRIEYELALADVRSRIEDDIAELIDGKVDLNEVEDIVTEASGEDEASA